MSALRPIVLLLDAPLLLLLSLSIDRIDRIVARALSRRDRESPGQSGQSYCPIPKQGMDRDGGERLAQRMFASRVIKSCWSNVSDNVGALHRSLVRVCVSASAFSQDSAATLTHSCQGLIVVGGCARGCDGLHRTDLRILRPLGGSVVLVLACTLIEEIGTGK